MARVCIIIELACPRIYRFILKTENVGQTISDPRQKLIVYTLPSIWYYPFFQNDVTISVHRQNQHFQSFCIVLPIGLPIVLPIVLPMYCQSKQKHRTSVIMFGSSCRGFIFGCNGVLEIPSVSFCFPAPPGFQYICDSKRNE